MQVILRNNYSLLILNLLLKILLNSSILICNELLVILLKSHSSGLLSIDISLAQFTFFKSLHVKYATNIKQSYFLHAYSTTLIKKSTYRSCQFRVVKRSPSYDTYGITAAFLNHVCLAY